ncbi:hypothetical protein FB567DRAFT_346360 [Paraphoma chrysanthemicola]|uniref:Uncharacterized protein n=1 Tax=Paraphoma chrysanthemicola TaxID=798071 RepID=A0A8K0R6V6_9PLEO|nr:hypothetical protein FB567DRAFT_346360 [Paraphoma chrysanthemicola]
MLFNLLARFHKGRRRPEAPTAAIAPFRLLDLPKEIRLMIYEELTISWNHHALPLDSAATCYGTIMNPSLPGVRLLATCRFINKEAGTVLRKQLKRMMQPHPTIFVDVDQLPGLVPIRSAFGFRMNLVARILSSMASSLHIHAIHKYRSGNWSIEKLRISLGMSKHFSDDQVKALASFILHTAAYNNREREVHSLYPPLAIVVSIPASFSTMQLEFVSSYSGHFFRKYILRRSRTRIQTVQADMNFMAYAFAYYTSAVFALGGTMEAVVMLEFPDEAHLYDDLDSIEFDFKMFLDIGARVSRHEGWLRYIGLYADMQVRE